ncbi:MAG TPA: peptidoglycan DD-metalloendopeptidase family protein [Burkholderiales bacterium]|nr:peptidoglycan DD-metalloendopeptidase family protein [Burkholderiales bacterium]
MAGAAQAAPKEEDLAALRKRIDALTAELEKKEANRREARDALRDSERAISRVNFSLRKLEGEAATLRAEAARLAADRASLERRLAHDRRAVERMLVARYAGGASDVLRVALSGDDPAGLGRRLHYAAELSRAAAALIAGYRAGVRRLGELAEQAAARQARLDGLEQERRRERAHLAEERAARQRVLASLGAELSRGRREMKILKADEARLARLIEELARVLPPAPGEKKFSRLRGHLPLPVRGEPIGRFGGLFIRAPQGQPVRAVARGRVVYADWMRGFGNLLILDHGENYLSIYANNEALLKQVGDIVEAGEPLAVTGSSGGNEETGLYFEMRHLGRPFDPRKWVQLK